MEIGPGRLLLIAFTIVAAAMVGIVAGGAISDSAEEVDNEEILYQYIDSFVACEAVGGRPSSKPADEAWTVVNATGSDFESCWPPD